MILQDNARKLEHNQTVSSRRVAALQEAGAFRRPLATRKFKRGFRATYGPLEVPTRVEGTRVESATGAPIDVKHVQIVPADSSEASGTFAHGGARDDAKRAQMEELAG